MRTYVGWDNGPSGALAILKVTEEALASGLPSEAPHLILTPIEKQGGRSYLDVVAIHHLLRELQNPFLAIEQTQIQPIFSATTNHSQGHSEGCIYTLLRLFPYRHTMVRPAIWQREMHEGVRRAGQDTKSASVEACRRLFPGTNLVPPGCRKPSDAYADALLIAEWARKNNL